MNTVSFKSIFGTMREEFGTFKLVLLNIYKILGKLKLCQIKALIIKGTAVKLLIYTLGQFLINIEQILLLFGFLRRSLNIK